MSIKGWIGEPVAVNRRDERQIVGLLDDVDKLGVTLTRAGARELPIRATVFVPWLAITDVFLASTLPTPAEPKE